MKTRRHYWELPESTKRAYVRAVRKQQKGRQLRGLCVNCGKRPLITKTHCVECREAWAQRQKARNFKLKDEVFAAYGGQKCDCECNCITTEREFLTMDHIGGRAAHGHDKSMTGPVFYRWLKKNNFPPGFRVLCMNCNFAHGHAGYCPRARTPRVGSKQINNQPTQCISVRPVA